MKLLDELQKRYDIPNDRQLGLRLKLGAPIISRIRNNKNAVSSEVILRIHEELGIPVAEIRELCQ